VHNPADFPRRVLLTVSGLTPQIITETIYALAVNRAVPFLPTRLVVMTTSDGANRVRLTLSGSAPGWLARLREDYQLPPIAFNPADLSTLADRSGAALADIRTDADNVAAADAITEMVRELTADADCALHVSLAGGRKTLGFFAAYALSLYGRAQDRLSHVLVSPEFESNPDFYYPTPYDQVIYTRERAPLNTRDARVSLADIPFVRMRGGLSEALRTGRASYAEAVAAVQGQLDPPRLVIDRSTRTVRVGRSSIELDPSLLAFYLWFARKCGTAEPRIGMSETGRQFIERRHTAAFLEEYGRWVNVTERPELIDALKNGMDLPYFRSKRAKLNRILRSRIIDPSPERYLIQRFGRRGRAEYGVELPRETVSIIE